MTRPTEKEIQKRVTGSMPEEYFAPQCNTCIHNNGSTDCLAWAAAIPDKYRWNQEACPKYDHLPGCRTPEIQQRIL